MKLTHCVNGFVASPGDMPTYGQLGCQGFIILDHEHHVISEGTTPFMQVRSLAFQHVEALLDAVCKHAPLPTICPGEMGELLAVPGHEKLKGYKGVCVKLHDGGKVDFGFMDGPMQGKMLTVEESMVRRLDSDAEMGGGGGSCGGGSCGTCSDGTCGLPKEAQACGERSSKGCGCDPSTCEKAECKIDDAFLEEYLDIASVKVSSMDEEHAECSKSLRLLAEKRSRETLEDALRCLSEHFAHEEEMFETYGFGQHVNEKLSAKKSHMEEHRRLLDKVRRQLSAATQAVPVGFVKELLKEFHEHTSLYDMQYADFLAAKGAH